jgi:hypothetical protein
MKPALGPGPSFDPMDPIIQNIENIESFLSQLAVDPEDLQYVNSHLPGILALRRTMNNQIDALSSEPYNYTPAQLKILHQEIENIFLYLEGAVGALNPLHVKELKKMVKATEDSIKRFDRDLIP